MFSDRRIKKELNKELKPTISSDQFCLDAGIEFVDKTPKRKGNNEFLSEFLLPIVSILAVSLCIILPFTLGHDDGVNNQPKYGENDVVYEVAEIESICSDEKLKMFNQSFVQRYGTSYQIMPNGGKTKLGYKLSDIIYAEVVNGIPSFAVTFDFMVRCYDGFTMESLDAYSNKDKYYTQKDMTFGYRIVCGNNDNTAYISFEYEKYDYFIRLSSFGQLTEINDDSVQLFLQKAFLEEEQADESVNRRQVDS